MIRTSAFTTGISADEAISAVDGGCHEGRLCKTKPIICVFEARMVISLRNEAEQTRFGPAGCGFRLGVVVLGAGGMFGYNVTR